MHFGPNAEIRCERELPSDSVFFLSAVLSRYASPPM